MLFTSFQFILFFLPIVLLVACHLRKQPLLIWIACSSFVFYAMVGHAWFLIPMLITTTLDFYLALWMEKTLSISRRRTILGISLCGNLGLLIYFKYSGLLVQLSQHIGSWLGMTPHGAGAAFFLVTLPAGISFYTFQTLSYMIDIYHSHAKAEKNFFKFASFVSFFPHLVAGPLTRHHQLIPALDHISEEGVTPMWESGIFLFAIGLCKKILLADRIGVMMDFLLEPKTLGFIPAWLAIFGYGLQIYFDFSGYSDMAIGLGRLLGIELPQNFNSPYKAANPRDFWRRWHMTLSSWLRDYLYIPLGGNRGGPFRQAFNLLVTMFLGGLWHGAHWTFAAWGIYHGCLLIFYSLNQKTWDTWPTIIQRSFTFILVSLGWVFFRSDNFPMATKWLMAAFGLCGWFGDLGEFSGFIPSMFGFVVLGLWFVNAFPNASSRRDWADLTSVEQVALGTLTATSLLYLNQTSMFLYFQF